MSQAPISWVRVGPVSSLTFAPGHLANVEGSEVAIFESGGEYFAIENSCVHQGGPLCEGDLVDGAVMCPWHGWRYDARTGKCLTMPGEDVKAFATRVVDGCLEIGLTA